MQNKLKNRAVPKAPNSIGLWHFAIVVVLGGLMVNLFLTVSSQPVHDWTDTKHIPDSKIWIYDTPINL